MSVKDKATDQIGFVRPCRFLTDNTETRIETKTPQDFSAKGHIGPKGTLLVVNEPSF
jgi:hypothetical protein